MRNFFTILYKKVIQTYLLYKVLTLFFQITDKVYKYRVELENDLKRKSEVLSKNIFTSQKVLNGPFKGLNYSDIQSKGSQLYPKLLGSCEEELQYHLSFILSREPDLVIDIGCAEGYYAVGIALKLKGNDCKIIAIDIDEQALNECTVLADRNNIKEKLSIERVANSHSQITPGGSVGLISTSFSSLAGNLWKERESGSSGVSAVRHSDAIPILLHTRSTVCSAINLNVVNLPPIILTNPSTPSRSA